LYSKVPTESDMQKHLKALRLSHSEMKQIELFLKQNPMFDFSSLARTAIQEFIRNPRVTIVPLKVANRTSTPKKEQERGNNSTR
jgi:hypothetical protein